MDEDLHVHVGELRFANVVAYSIVLATGLRISDSWGEVLDAMADELHVPGDGFGTLVVRAAISTAVFTTFAGISMCVASRISRTRDAVSRRVRRSLARPLAPPPPAPRFGAPLGSITPAL